MISSNLNNKHLEYLPNEILNIYDVAFTGFPKKEMYRMYIDRKCQHLGKKAFDQSRMNSKGFQIVGEPGYHKAMKNGFNFIKKTITQKMNVDFIIELHDICIHNLKGCYAVYVTENYNLSYKFLFLDMKKGLHPDRSYPFNSSKMTESAVRECYEEGVMSKAPWYYNGTEFTDSDEDEDEDEEVSTELTKLCFLSTYDKERVYSSYQCSRQNESEPRSKVNELCDKYYEEITNASCPESKLKAIVRFCRALEIYHVFYDGNQRTIAFCLLNKLLIENGFSPCTLAKPNMFDGYFGIDEMVAYVQEGMETFKSYKT